MAEVIFSPGKVKGKFPVDTHLSEAASDLGLELEQLCGERGICGSCKIIVQEGKELLSPVSASEHHLLSEEEIENGYRLSCRAKIVSDGRLRISIPPESLRSGEIVLTEGVALELERDPSIVKYPLLLDRSHLDDPRADYERLTETLSSNYEIEPTGIDYLVQRELPGAIRSENDRDNHKWPVTVTLFSGEDGEIIDVEGGVREKTYGVAMDIGTTTLAGYLVNLNTGEAIGVSSMLNPQMEYGEDLMSRAEFSVKNNDGRKDLRKSIIRGINTILEDLIAQTGVPAEQIYEVDMVGNTAMHHLFFGIDVGYLIRSPYPPARQSSMKIKARDAGIKANPSGYVYWPPINGGWVGADNVSVMLASQIYKEPEKTLVIDIGTNGEVVFGNEDRAYAASTAAGPALEGAEIKHGVRAQQGSIEEVTIDRETLVPSYQTIGNNKPCGICGSGIIDAAAEMVKTGIITRSGRFSQTARDHERVRHGDGGIMEYILAPKEESAARKPITITQEDIREIQKAKGAIQAASILLMNRWGADEADRVLIAGAFGNYIDTESALTIGLYPEVNPDQVKSIGNAAGEGAKLTLLSKKMKQEADRVPDMVEFVEIGGTDKFNDLFMDAIYFPHR